MALQSYYNTGPASWKDLFVHCVLLWQLANLSCDTYKVLDENSIDGRKGVSKMVTKHFLFKNWYGLRTKSIKEQWFSAVTHVSSIRFNACIRIRTPKE
jgi:hypothetical protein